MRFGRPGGLEQHLTNQGANLANCDFLAVENKHENGDLANLLPSAANETPVALTGATGAMSNELAFKTREYRNRARAATVLCLAIAECHRDDAVQILDAALASMSCAAGTKANSKCSAPSSATTSRATNTRRNGSTPSS